VEGQRRGRHGQERSTRPKDTIIIGSPPLFTSSIHFLRVMRSHCSRFLFDLDLWPARCVESRRIPNDSVADSDRRQGQAAKIQCPWFSPFRLEGA
jgi:hypothetical protein